MPFSRYKGYNLRKKIFLSFLVIAILTVVGTTIISYFVLKNNAQEQSLTEMQQKSEALMASLDYAVSHTQLNTEDLPHVLKNELFKICDIAKQDLVLYDLKGQYLMSNKDDKLIPQKTLETGLVNRILQHDRRVDITTFDEAIRSNVTSSYQVLKNNMLEPIAIVYIPYYHDDMAYTQVFNNYMKFIVLLDVVIILVSAFMSWFISRNLTETLTRFSNQINRITLFDRDIKPIKYYRNDELGTLVKAYNKMILEIQSQKERISFMDKEEAWREMAKQVAHEVKNPLTPMKLTIQNFERRFDPNDPKIHDKVKNMSRTLVDQIDLIATVATAFSQFAQLPEKYNEVFNLVEEVKSIVRIFNDDSIFIHSNKERIDIKMDKIYLNRVITNLVTNAKQAKSDDRDLIVNIDIEQINKRITVVVEDNGIGMTEDMYERIFEPNFTSKSSGMGLGLTMVRKMIRDYDGDITVTSQVGKGTKFFISLPTNI